MVGRPVQTLLLVEVTWPCCSEQVRMAAPNCTTSILMTCGQELIGKGGSSIVIWVPHSTFLFFTPEMLCPGQSSVLNTPWKPCNSCLTWSYPHSLSGLDTIELLM